MYNRDRHNDYNGSQKHTAKISHSLVNVYLDLLYKDKQT